MKSHFVCQRCGVAQPKWTGQCSSCGAWNTLVEEVVETETASKLRQSSLKLPAMIGLDQLMQATHSQQVRRQSSGVTELDRVLGGGMVPGEVILLTGSPGIGKSTLLTQMILGLLTKNTQKKAKQQPIVYLAGEESPSQIALRIKRIAQSEHLGWSKSLEKTLATIQFISDTNIDRALVQLEKLQPRLLVVDSVQTLTSDRLTGVAGSVGQVKATTEALIRFAKIHQTVVFLVGHVTKEGRVAGPMVLEHMVDAVLNFIGDKSAGLRLLRASKNRFGATDEVGVFLLDEFGFKSVADPSQLFTSHHDVSTAVGAVLSCVVEGARPLVVEVQALVVPSHLPVPRRVGQGIDNARLQVLAAVLEKYLKLPLGSHDVFVSIVGGYKTKEPALDLAVAAAIISSIRNKPMSRTVFVGEVGLLGEVRRVKLFDLRQKEVRRLGYKQLVSFKNTRHVKDLLA